MDKNELKEIRKQKFAQMEQQLGNASKGGR